MNSMIIDPADFSAVANILYNMSLDMDYADGDDCYSEEISIIADQIEKMPDGMQELLWRVAVSYSDFFDLFRPEV